MISQLGQVMVGVMDSVMIGRIGEISLAASSLANSVFFLFITFGMGMSFGITPLVAKAHGQDNKYAIGQILKSALLIYVLVGFILFVAVFLCIEYLYILEQPPEVEQAAKPYLTVIGFSIIPFMISQVFRQFTDGLSFTRQSMYVMIAGNITNIALNYILIYGKFGAPEMGLVGAGIATLISRVVMLLLLTITVFYHKKLRIYTRIITSVKTSVPTIKALLRIGIPSGMQFSFEVSAFVAAAIMMGWLGATELAAHQIAMSLATVSYMMASGLSTAATIRVGNQLGLKDIQTLREAAFSIFAMVVVTEIVWTLIFILGKDVLPTLFIHEHDVIAIASSLLIMAAFFQLSDGIQVVGLSALRGLSDVKLPTVFTFSAYWVIGLPLGYYCGFKTNMGPQGIWLGLIAGLTISAICLVLRFQLLTKRMLNPLN